MAVASEIEEKLSDLRIGIIYSDVKREYFYTEAQYITEKDAYNDACVIAEELKKLGVTPLLYPGNETLIVALLSDQPDMVFDLVDSVNGEEYLTSTIPGILDMIGMPYTGAGLLGLALCYNKFLTKQLMKNAMVPVPNFQLFHSPNDVIDVNLRYPLIVKLNEIHGAVEITKDAVVENEKQLRDRLSYLMKTYEQSVLVEEFIAGREITCMVLHGTNTKIYMAEKVFNKPDEKYVFATFDDQWINTAGNSYTYEKYEEPNLRYLVKKAFEITKMADYGKFDVRLDSSGRYYFIDSNANPAFGPKSLTTAMGYIIQDLYNVPFSEILKRMIENTLLDPDNQNYLHGLTSALESANSNGGDSGSGTNYYAPMIAALNGYKNGNGTTHSTSETNDTEHYEEQPGTDRSRSTQYSSKQ
uniref:ATP-grasp domain-containing protein n=1 Tax=candidate division WWE3 bacterium TaxID=2053526 RepID=A0A7C4TK28_UNCKA